MSKGLIQAGLGLVITVAAGCQYIPNIWPNNSSDAKSSKGTAVTAPTTQYTPVQEAAGPQPSLEDAQAQAAAAAALAARVQAVTQNLEPLVAKRNHPSPPEVQWGDSYSMHLTDVPGASGNGSQAGHDNAGVQSAAAPAAYVAAPWSAAPAQIAPGQAAPGQTAPGQAGAGPAVPGQAALAAAAPAAVMPKAISLNDGWEQKLAQRAKDYPHDTAAQLDYQMLLFLHDEQVPQLEALTALSKEDQEIMSATLDALSNFRMVLRTDDNAMSSRKVRPLLELADRLRAQAELTISAAALCTKVDGFGRYEPIEPLRFVAGKENPAILYCELENFSSQQDEKRMWVTRLQEQAVLYTDSGLQVWDDHGKGLNPGTDAPREIVDQSRNRRHDFCLAKRINLPSTLSIGRYVLKITLIDEQAHRIAEATLPVQIVAQ